MMWLNMAFDWAEKNDKPIVAFRDADDGDWRVKMELRDSRGWFNVCVALWDKGQKTVTHGDGTKTQVKLTEDEFRDQIEKQLMGACQKARENRMRDYTKVRISGKAA